MQLRSGETVVEDVGDNEDWEEVNVCDSRTSYILPRAAKSIKGSFMFIVNQPAQEKLSQVGWKDACKGFWRKHEFWWWWWLIMMMVIIAMFISSVFEAIWCSSPPLMSSFVPGSEGDYLQRTRRELLRRTTWREGGTSNCVSPAVHGPQVGGAGPGEGGGGGRDLLLPLLLLLLCGCWHALAMTQAHHCSGPY